jgi:hypothetical protein
MIPHWTVITSVSFVQALIATLEVSNISRDRWWRAGIMSALNAATYSVVAILFIVDDRRIGLVPWYIIGNAAGTVLGTFWGRRNGKH